MGAQTRYSFGKSEKVSKYARVEWWRVNEDSAKWKEDDRMDAKIDWSGEKIEGKKLSYEINDLFSMDR